MPELNPEIYGQKIGYLKVLRKINKMYHGGFSWECECVCGKIVRIRNHQIKQRVSCGCLRYHPRVRNKYIENENNINKMRIEEGLTQKELSIAIGISQGYLVNIIAIVFHFLKYSIVCEYSVNIKKKKVNQQKKST